LQDAFPNRQCTLSLSINHDLDSCELRYLRSQPPTGARGSTATQTESRSRSTSGEKKRKETENPLLLHAGVARAVGFHVRLPTHTHHDNTMRQAFPLLLPPITALGAPQRRAQVGSHTRGARCWLLAAGCWLKHMACRPAAQAVQSSAGFGRRPR
jgi:hypothetical protein